MLKRFRHFFSRLTLEFFSPRAGIREERGRDVLVVDGDGVGWMLFFFYFNSCEPKSSRIQKQARKFYFSFLGFFSSSAASFAFFSR